MYDIKKKAIRIYEKALPNDFTWLEKMQAAKQAGFDYIEISIDESDERLARLDWSDEQIERNPLLYERDRDHHSKHVLKWS